MPEKTFNLEEVAEYLHIPPHDIERMAREGEIPCARKGTRLEFRRREVDAWASKRIMNFSSGDLTKYHRVTSAKNHDLTRNHAIIPELMRVEYIDAAMNSKTQPSVIRDMVTLANRTGLLVYPDDLLDSLVKRENLGSTALTGGFAILHPQHHEPYMFEDSFIALGRTVQPVPFSSPDGQQTSIFFLLCCQDDRTHLHMLARICMMCQYTSLIMDLQLATDAQEMMKSMASAEEQVIRGL
ncbi:MAG: PTS sugar transporter subunit IIA [Kiritimatiellia bacterium]